MNDRALAKRQPFFLRKLLMTARIPTANWLSQRVPDVYDGGVFKRRSIQREPAKLARRSGRKKHKCRPLASKLKKKWDNRRRTDRNGQLTSEKG
jgi:hypothetical protein